MQLTIKTEDSVQQMNVAESGAKESNGANSSHKASGANGSHKASGSNGAQKANGADGAKGAAGTGTGPNGSHDVSGTSAARIAGATEAAKQLISGAKRALRPAEWVRTAERSVEDLREALLQVASGTLPYVPRIRLKESDEAILVSVALPDADERSLEVSFDGSSLRIKGTKIQHKERTRRRYRQVADVYRTFERTIVLHGAINRDKAFATLRKDVLRVHVPKAKTGHEPVSATPVTAESLPVPNLE